MNQNQRIKTANQVILQEISALQKLSKSFSKNFLKAVETIKNFGIISGSTEDRLKQIKSYLSL